MGLTHSTSGHIGGNVTSSMASGTQSTTGMSNVTGTTSAGTTSAAAGATKKVEGKVSVEVGTKADCDKLKNSSKFADKLCEEIIKLMGLPSTFDNKNCAITTACGYRRRLAEERRLAVAVNSAFAVSGLTANPASAGSTAVAGKSAADVKAAIMSAVAADTSLSGINVTGVKVIAKPKTTDTSNVSAAVALGFLSMVVFAGVAHIF